MPRDGEGEPTTSGEESLKGRIMVPKSNLFCLVVLSILGKMSVL